jgi:hypothetical protein
MQNSNVKLLFSEEKVKLEINRFPVIPTLRRILYLDINLGYIARPCFKKEKK